MQTIGLTREAEMLAPHLTYRNDGAQRFRGALSPEGLQVVIAATRHVATDRPGKRLYGMGAAVDGILSSAGAVGSRVAEIQGSGTQPVRAVLFDKKVAMNWGLGWHQDRTVAVAEKVEVPGFGPWTVKDGALHVAPPFEILSDMVTVASMNKQCLNRV